MNRTIYNRAVFDDYVSFHEMKEDLDDICLELSDVGIDIFKTGINSLQFQHSKDSSWNIAELMDESIVDEVIDRLKFYMNSKDWDVKIHKTYHYSYARRYFFHRLINRYKGKLSYTRLDFVNRNERPLQCWDIVANEGFGRVVHP